MNKQPKITEATRKNIEDAFLSALKSTPMQRITVANICSIACIHRSTFYRYFADTFAVLESIEDRLLSQLTERMKKAIESNPLSSFAEIPDRFSDVVTVYINELYYLTGKNGDPSFKNRLIESVKPIVLPILPLSSDSENIDYIVTIIFTLMITTMNYKFEHKDFDVKNIKSSFISLFLNE